jgi:hypothetical protein
MSPIKERVTMPDENAIRAEIDARPAATMARIEIVCDRIERNLVKIRRYLERRLADRGGE